VSEKAAKNLNDDLFELLSISTTQVKKKHVYHFQEKIIQINFLKTIKKEKLDLERFKSIKSI
jgi:ribosomal protein L17